MQNKEKEPLVHIVRQLVPPKHAWLIRLIAVALALLVCALFAYLSIGISPIAMYGTMLRGAFGGSLYIAETLAYATKLLLIAVALAPAFRMRFWNIGGEGQVLAGALGTAIIMVKLGDKVPAVVLFILMALTAVLAGMVWGFVPAFFKARFNTNETLFTLMMNYVAMQLVDFYYNKWRGVASSLGKLNKASRAGWFPLVLGHRYTIGIILILVIAVLMYFYMTKTKQGYEIAVVGESTNTARYAGIDVKKVTIRTMILSGALCGLCGFLTVSGQDQTISTTTAGGYGFTALIVAWLAKFNTLSMIFISILIVALEKGTRLIADSYANFSDSASSIVVGIILFFVIGSEFFIRYKLIWRKKNAAKEEV